MLPEAEFIVRSDEVGRYQDALARLLEDRGMTYKTFAGLVGPQVTEIDVDNFLRRKSERPRVTDKVQAVCRVIHERFGGLQAWVKTATPLAAELQLLQKHSAPEHVFWDFDFSGTYIGKTDNDEVCQFRIFSDIVGVRFEMARWISEYNPNYARRWRRSSGLCVVNGPSMQLIGSENGEVIAMFSFATVIIRAKRFPTVLRGFELRSDPVTGATKQELFYAFQSRTIENPMEEIHNGTLLRRLEMQYGSGGSVDKVLSTEMHTWLKAKRGVERRDLPECDSFIGDTETRDLLLAKNLKG